VEGPRLCFERTTTGCATAKPASAGTRVGPSRVGPLARKSLDAVVYTTALWYAWRSQRPDTTLWSPE
jgi:hypothetical protein